MNRKESKGKRKAIAIVRPQQHVRENNTPEKLSRADLDEDQESRGSSGSLDKKEKVKFWQNLLVLCKMLIHC